MFKKLIAVIMFCLGLSALAAPAHAQWAGQWQPATTTATQPTTTTTTTATQPTTTTWQPGQPAWGTFGGGAPVMNQTNGQYIYDGRVENPVNRVVYDEPGRRNLYNAQALATNVNTGIAVVGILAQLFQPRQPQPQPAAAQPTNGLAQCTANGQPSGVYVDNSDNRGLERCNAIFNSGR